MKNPNAVRIAWISLLFFFGIVLVQSVFHPFREIKLNGAFTVPEGKTLTWHNWFDGSFQQSWTNRLNRQFAFLPDAIRLKNQLDYSLFGLHTDAVIQHEDGRLYERGYLPSICGQDFIGGHAVDKKLDSLLAFDAYLKANNKQLVLVTAPTKWRTLLDPAQWPCGATDTTNYGLFKKNLSHVDLAWFDGIQLFPAWKDSLPYPVHSRNGTHWSIYGAATLAHYIGMSAPLKQKLPPFHIKHLDVSKEARNTDKDLADLLNLIIRPADDTLAYPVLSFDSSRATKPTALIIGDSYYWTFYYLGLHGHWFDGESRFLYYNQTAFGADRNQGQHITDAERLELLRKADIVVFLAAEPSFAHYGYGFLSDVWPEISGR